MKRATITFPDALERKIDTYLKRQPTPPSLSTLVQAALEEYLDNHEWRARDYRPAAGVLTLPVSAAAVEPEVGAEHDRYLAEALLVRKAVKD